MTDISLTAAQIRSLTGAVIRRYRAGADLSVGDLVYLETASTTREVNKADANDSAATAKAIGIVVESYDGETTVYDGDVASVVVHGPVSGFSGATPGSYGYVSNTAGKLADAAGTFSFIMGYFEDAGVFFVEPGVDDPTSS